MAGFSLVVASLGYVLVFAALGVLALATKEKKEVKN